MPHPPEYIPEMYKLWKEEHYEVIEGIKKHEQKKIYTETKGRPQYIIRTIIKKFYH